MRHKKTRQNRSPGSPRYNHLVIRDNRIYLDGAEIKGVTKYRLEAEGHGKPLLVLELYVENKGTFTPNVST